jgi:Na+-transporting NADH:ubiquinone oxidoreductase subunit C
VQRDTTYIIVYSAVVCLVCSVLVAGAAVALKDRQDENAVLDRQRKVLVVGGLMTEGEALSNEEVKKRFAENFQPMVISLKTGEEAKELAVDSYDQQKELKDPGHSRAAPQNPAQIQRIPEHALVYRLVRNAQTEALILPIEGKGLWSTMYGFVALNSDLTTIKGLTFYKHGETPGLGGEVDNPKWKALWPGRKAFAEKPDNNPRIEVIKGTAGNAAADPHRVDGLSGATITSRGVGHTLRFWFGENGFGPFLQKMQQQNVGSGAPAVPAAETAEAEAEHG